MMKGTFQVVGLKSHVLPNFKSLYGLKIPLGDSSETYSATSGSLYDLNYPREIQVRSIHH
jgi:hypothetical protein